MAAVQETRKKLLDGLEDWLREQIRAIETMPMW
jgi:hypothetical protein